MLETRVRLAVNASAPVIAKSCGHGLILASIASTVMDKQVEDMINTIKLEARDAAPWVGKADIDPRVLAAMAAVPRHEFVPPGVISSAYENGPLPIGHGQTISQPYLVALMTDLLRTRPEYTILEVGTGSGFQTAVLSQLVGYVYSIELVRELADRAAARLRRLGYGHVETRWGDGYHGWPEHAPYDGIIVTAAVYEIPQPLIDQLKPGGRLIAPVGIRYQGQDLIVLEKDAQGRARRHKTLPVAFVPLSRLDEVSLGTH
ncbi:MAG: protein-L-isoaspartate(D-aspartate) O-methyltransferase [Gammaproteobacteria bacterium]|jgi:protein-L-isoaspartate(D-aspartate) O-methyltransferase